MKRAELFRRLCCIGGTRAGALNSCGLSSLDKLAVSALAVRPPCVASADKLWWHWLASGLRRMTKPPLFAPDTQAEVKFCLQDPYCLQDKPVVKPKQRKRCVRQRLLRLYFICGCIATRSFSMFAAQGERL